MSGYHVSGSRRFVYACIHIYPIYRTVYNNKREEMFPFDPPSLMMIPCTPSSYPVIIPGSGVCKDCPAGKTCISDNGAGIAATSSCPVGKFCLAATVSVFCLVRATYSLYTSVLC